MTEATRGFQHDSEMLIQQVDRQLALLRSVRLPHEAALAERLAACLRELIASTTRASAADRARVRAAVHYFALRNGRNDRHAARSLLADQRVVNEIALGLGRGDLVIDGPIAA